MGRALVWIVDAIILFFIVRAVMRLFSGVRGQRQASSGAPPFRRQEPERIGGTLVQDPHCGTYIPESRAVTVVSGGRTLYFCSEACRDAFTVRA